MRRLLHAIRRWWLCTTRRCSYFTDYLHYLPPDLPRLADLGHHVFHYIETLERQGPFLARLMKEELRFLRGQDLQSLRSLPSVAAHFQWFVYDRQTGAIVGFNLTFEEARKLAAEKEEALRAPSQPK